MNRNSIKYFSLRNEGFNVLEFSLVLSIILFLLTSIFYLSQYIQIDHHIKSSFDNFNRGIYHTNIVSRTNIDIKTYQKEIYNFTQTINPEIKYLLIVNIFKFNIIYDELNSFEKIYSYQNGACKDEPKNILDAKTLYLQSKNIRNSINNSIYIIDSSNEISKSNSNELIFVLYRA